MTAAGAGDLAQDRVTFKAAVMEPSSNRDMLDDDNEYILSLIGLSVHINSCEMNFKCKICNITLHYILALSMLAKI